VNRSWSGFLPQNEVIILQWALMEANWSTLKELGLLEKSLVSDIQRRALGFDGSALSVTDPPDNRKR